MRVQCKWFIVYRYSRVSRVEGFEGRRKQDCGFGVLGSPLGERRMNVSGEWLGFGWQMLQTNPLHPNVWVHYAQLERKAGGRVGRGHRGD